jgi:hypothetical protein
MVGASPGFPVQPVASAHPMRLSLMKAAHAVVSSAAYRKSGSPVFSAQVRLGEPGAPVQGERGLASGRVQLPKVGQYRFVESHISRKTSEIWGTRGLVAP